VTGGSQWAGPLAGRAILLTRPADRSRGLGRELERLGARVFARPTIAFEPPTDPEPARAAARQASTYDWIVFSSANGVRFFLKALGEVGGAVGDVRGRCLAIGQATALALTDAIKAPTAVAGDSRSEGLAAMVRGRVGARDRVLLVRPEVAREVIDGAIRATGATLVAAAFYRTVAARGIELTAADVAAGRFDIAVFTSPSTLDKLVEASGASDPAVLEGLRRAAIVAIGKTTARAVERRGLTVAALAAEPSDRGLLVAIESLVDG
jgi:uroporphyrinogen-III synthase